jgi:hypothetical protein
VTQVFILFLKAILSRYVPYNIVYTCVRVVARAKNAVLRLFRSCFGQCGVEMPQSLSRTTVHEPPEARKVRDITLKVFSSRRVRDA